jgi:hypothetical protein
MTLWLSGDCITYTSSVCGTPSNGSTITSWADRSGNGNSILYNNGSSVTFNTNQINGLPAAAVGNTQWKLNSTIAASTGYSAFSVIKLSGTARGDLFGPVLITGGDGFKWWFTTVQGADSSSAVQLGTGTTTLSTSTWFQSNVTFVNNSSTLNFRLSRATDTTSGATSHNITGAIGTFFASGVSSELFAGSVAEVILYNRVLSGTEITTVEAYLNQKYGL